MINIKKIRCLSPRSVALAGAALTLLLCAGGYFNAWREYHKQFTSDAAMRAAVVINALNEHLLKLDGVRRFIEGTDRFDQKSFNMYAQPIVAHPGIQTVAWLPVVPARERSMVEQAAGRAGLAGFRITERSPDRSLVAAAARAVYYPIYLLKSRKSNALPLGFDMGSDPDRLAALRIAESTGQTSATAPVRLLQEREEQQGFLVFTPVHDAAHRLRGFALGVFRAGDLFEEELRSTVSLEFDTTLKDLSAAPGHQLLHRSKVSAATSGQLPGVDDFIFPALTYRQEFLYAGRRWEITCDATRGYHADNASLGFLLVLPAGLLVTGLSAQYLRRQNRYREEIETLVRVRTAELALANTSLTSEIETRRDAETTIARANQEWARTFDAVPDLIMLLDTDHRIMRANRAQTERLEVTPAELLGKRCCTALHGSATPAVFCPSHLLLQDGKEHYVEARFPILVGDFLISVTPILDDDGKLVGMVHVSRDISELKRAEKNLRESQEFTVDVLNSLPFTIAVLDTDGVIVEVNEPWRRFARENSAAGIIVNAVGQKYLSTSPASADGDDDEIETTFIGINDVVQGERDFFSAEYHCHSPNEQRWFLMTASRLTGSIRGAVIAHTNITVRKQAEELILKQQRELHSLNVHLEQRVEDEVAKSRAKDLIVMRQDKMATLGLLAAGVAHEINSPLSYIDSNIRVLTDYLRQMGAYVTLQQEVLERTAAPEEQRRELAAAAQRLEIPLILDDGPALIAESLEGVERVSLIVRNLKGFSRMDAEEDEPADLTACLESALLIVQNELKYVATIAKEYVELPLILCLPGQLSQVFVNLLTNAGHAVASPGRITLKSRHDEYFVYVSVADNGHGIPEELRGRIFEPFFTTKEAGKGTGLGLSISHDIITRHHGELLVESSAGGGTVFTVKLPRNAEIS